jgi:hypothetical protein
MRRRIRTIIGKVKLIITLYRYKDWRKMAGFLIREEHGKFTLPTFRLNIWSDLVTQADRSLNDAEKHVVERLAQFLRGAPVTHYRMRWHRFSAQREEKDLIDIVHANFDDNGRLESIEPYLDSDGRKFAGLDPELKTKLNQSIIKIYNETVEFNDKKRPLILKRRLKRWLSSEQWMGRAKEDAADYIERVLSGTFIHFEQLPQGCSDLDRLNPPQFIKRKHPGFGMLNILCRFNDSIDEADLWVQFNHVAIDGIPAQKLMDDLTGQWGKCGDLKYPPASYKIPPIRCSTKNDKNGIYQVSQFMDFRPFLKVRKELNERYANQIGGDITIGSMLTWGLSHHYPFNKFVFEVVVNIPVGPDQEGILGGVFIRPSTYFDQKNPKEAFLEFEREFNLRFQAMREGNFIGKVSEKMMPIVLITIVKIANMGLLPLGDWFPHGGFGFGNLLMPAEDGSRVGSVGYIGYKDQLEDAMKAVKEVVMDFDIYVSNQ